MKRITHLFCLATAAIIAAGTLLSCGGHKQGENSMHLHASRADIARFAGNYIGIASTCGGQPEGIFHILTDKDSTTIYVPDCSFGADSCESLQNVYGEVKNGTVIFPKKDYTDKCGAPYTYEAQVAFIGDTMVYAFNFSQGNSVPFHCEVKMMRQR